MKEAFLLETNKLTLDRIWFLWEDQSPIIIFLMVQCRYSYMSKQSFAA